VLPSIFARKGLAGRVRAVKAFEEYFHSGGHEKASILMRNRYETGVRNGLSIKDIARYELGGSVAILVNTTPAAFWMLLYASSNPDILNGIRKEIGSIITCSTDEKGVKVNSLDIAGLKNSCPFLTSTFQEVLRHRSMGASVRQVMQDTFLDGRWLLKKDCMLQMPSRVIHQDASIWGTDVDDFNPRRFMNDERHQSAKGKRPPAAAFRAFGGGTTLCPGRHFATNEILALVSMFVIRYDITPASGTWSMPETNRTNVAAGIMEPDTDVEVEITPRQGFDDGRWVFSLRESKEIFSIASEDQVAE
jgi:cytochrome P450